MSKFETIGQFVKTLESEFGPDDLIDFNVNDLKYIIVKIGDKIIDPALICPAWTKKDEVWNVLGVGKAPTKVSDILSQLKTFLPDHQDDLITMEHANGHHGTIVKLETLTKIHLEAPFRCSYVMKHPKVIEHNINIRASEALTQLITDIEAFQDVEKDSHKVFKYAQHLYQILLIKQKLANPNLKVSVPYLHDEKFYSRLQDVKDNGQITFSEFKGIMVSSFDLPKVKKEKPTVLRPESTVGPDSVSPATESVKLYFVESDSFTMDNLLNEFTLTEAQLTKFFVEKDGKLVCQHPDILKSFQK